MSYDTNEMSAYRISFSRGGNPHSFNVEDCTENQLQKTIKNISKLAEFDLDILQPDTIGRETKLKIEEIK